MDVLMPQLGETVAEGKVTKWYKSVGDAVQPGDNLFEIETDKTSMDVPATAVGVLAEIRVNTGEVVPVGAVVAVIADAAGANASARPAVKGSRAAASAVACERCYRCYSCGECAFHCANQARSLLRGAHAQPRLWFRPACRRRHHHAAGAAAGGGGWNRRWPRARLRATRAHLREGRGGGGAAGARSDCRRLHRGTGQGALRGRQLRRSALDGLRATIAARLVQAKQTIPHFYLTADIAIDRSAPEAPRGSQRGSPERQGRQCQVQTLAQRPHHQGLGRCLAAGAGRQCGLGRRLHPPSCTTPTSALRGGRRRAVHPHHSKGRDQVTVHDLR